MIKILTDKLCSCENKNNILWKSDNIEVYKRFSQYIPHKIKDIIIDNIEEKQNTNNEILNIKNKDIPFVKKDIIEEKQNTNNEISKIKNKDIPFVKKDIIEEKQNTNNEILNIKNKDIPFVKKDIIEEKQNTNNEISKIKNKDIKPLYKPIEIILSETCTFNTNTSFVKQNLINFISKQEFSKVFGMKKSAEIMTGIVNNKWNISTALFISFLFDKEVNYNNTKIIYNKEKNTGIILTLQ